MEDDLTLAQVREHIEKEGMCLACGQKAISYWHPLSKSRVAALQKLYGAVLTSESNDIDTRDCGLSYAERSGLTILRFHGLIAKVKDEDGHHVKSHWLITRRGAAFIRNKITVPKEVKTYDNKVTDHSEELVSIIDILGEPYVAPPIKLFEPENPTPADLSGAVQQSLIDVPVTPQRRDFR